MALPLIGAGIALAPSIFGAIRGFGQRNRAKQLRSRAVDPGYQMNTAVIDSARILGDRYSNYQIPGYQRALENINQSYGDAFNQGLQGASSSGDVLDLASQIAYGRSMAVNELAEQNAQGTERALGDYLQAYQAAGQEYVNKNQYDNARYQQQLQEAASLYNAGETNIGNAINSVAQVGSALAMSYSNPVSAPQAGQYVPPAYGPLSGGRVPYRGLRQYNRYGGLPLTTFQ